MVNQSMKMKNSMTVEQALSMARCSEPLMRPEDVALRVLAAEIERLQADALRVKVFVDCIRKMLPFVS